jgi:hypothetical protein
MQCSQLAEISAEKKTEVADTNSVVKEISLIHTVLAVMV